MASKQAFLDFQKYCCLLCKVYSLPLLCSESPVLGFFPPICHLLLSGSSSEVALPLLFLIALFL